MKVKKKPKFIRHGAQFRKRIARKGWKKPRGTDSKQRTKVKYRPPLPQVGYRQPRKVRNLHPSGLMDVLVSNEKVLEYLDPKKHFVRIASGVGKRKKALIVEKAKSLGFRIANA